MGIGYSNQMWVSVPVPLSTDSQELALNCTVHKILLTVFTTNKLMPIIIWQLGPIVKPIVFFNWVWQSVKTCVNGKFPNSLTKMEGFVDMRSIVVRFHPIFNLQKSFLW